MIYLCHSQQKIYGMALMKSISGIRGTIGGSPNASLTPIDIVKYTAAYATIIQKNSKTICKIVIGRDGRMSGEMVNNLVVNTLIAMGIDVVDLGLSTTPTVEMAVVWEKANGGIILTASHNPKEWNALKLLNEKGEFISAELGQQLLEIADANTFEFAPVLKLGKVIHGKSYMQEHIKAILALPLIQKEKITKRNFKIVIDAINSTGATFVPALLNALGVTNITIINADITGNFAHNPEPLPEHLAELCNEVVAQKADLGIAVDPDVDRLCFVNEDGTLFGEEYTLVAVADYVLSKKKGATVSNLSSTKALQEITTLNHGCAYYASAVGEVNVVKMMKKHNAVIGGEGNGGIIYPELHYGRDALVGIALFLSLLAEFDGSIAGLKNKYPNYIISKNKIELTSDIDIADLFKKIEEKYPKNEINSIDGLKIFFDGDWVHLRPSNTEPIIRIYSESEHETKANNIAMKIIKDIKEIIA
jgi:phosphomannomutase